LIPTTMITRLRQILPPITSHHHLYLTLLYQKPTILLLNLPDRSAKEKFPVISKIISFNLISFNFFLFFCSLIIFYFCVFILICGCTLLFTYFVFVPFNTTYWLQMILSFLFNPL
jgi:hypothetical protein